MSEREKLLEEIEQALEAMSGAFETEGLLPSENSVSYQIDRPTAWAVMFLQLAASDGKIESSEYKDTCKMLLDLFGMKEIEADKLIERASHILRNTNEGEPDPVTTLTAYLRTKYSEKGRSNVIKWLEWLSQSDGHQSPEETALIAKLERLLSGASH